MKKLLVFSLLLCSQFLFAQKGNMAKHINEIKKHKNSKNIMLFNRIHVPNAKESRLMAKGLKKHHDLFDVDANQITTIMKDEPDLITVPLNINGTIRQVTMEKVAPSEINILTSDNKKHKIPKTVHYRGSIDGDDNSLTDFTFDDNGLMGFVGDATGNYNVGKLDSSSAYVIAAEGKFTVVNGYTCNSTAPVQQYELGELTTTKCVRLYWETDYDLFVNKGSVAAVTTYMQGIFNQVQTFYFNDGLSISLKTLYINTTVDKYTGTSTNDYLTQFSYHSPYLTDSSQKTNNARGYGDIAMLMGISGGGGIAWIGTLDASNAAARTAYCAISTTYSAMPNYSWTVDVIAHELGHSFGSPHTHECCWNGNNTPIDACGCQTTGCYGYGSGGVLGNCGYPGIPAGGGTIMSYCHLKSVGKNFTLGFGSQPLMLLKYYVEHSTVLTTCSTSVPPAPVPPTCLIIGKDTIVQGDSTLLTATAGMSSYSWNTGGKLQGIYVKTAGTYSVVITASNGLTATCSKKLNIKPVSPPTPPPTSICPVPLVITCSILQRSTDVIVNRSGYTNYKYSWKKNGVQQSWTGQTINKALYVIGDKLDCIVTSTNTQTTTKCYVPCACSVVIK